MAFAHQLFTYRRQLCKIVDQAVQAIGHQMDEEHQAPVHEADRVREDRVLTDLGLVLQVQAQVHPLLPLHEVAVAGGAVAPAVVAMMKMKMKAMG